MSAVTIFVGLAGGLLLATVSIPFWGSLAGLPRLAEGGRAAAWAAAGVLAVGALLAWGGSLPALGSLTGPLDATAQAGPVLSVILMATLAIPLHIESRAEGLGGRVAPYLPALTLTAAAFVEVVSPGQRAVPGDWMTPTRFLVAVCAGLGARALGQALRVMVAGSSLALWSGSVAYGVLTLVSGSIGLVSLWQRGVLWTGSHAVMSGGIAAAWLAWSASWLTPSRYPRVRAGLTAMAALQLISAAIK